MAADLGSVEFGVKVDTSQLDAIVSAIGKVEASVKGLQSTFDSMGNNASSAAGKASSSTSDLAKAMEDAATKGKLFADAIETGLSKVIDLAKSAASSFVGLVESSVQSYASFEQSFGAADRFFKGSYEGATGGKGVMAAYNKEIDNSGTTFNDIGVSMQDFFDLTNQLLPRLVKDNAEARAKIEYEAKGGMIRTAEEQKAALDTELSQLKSNLQSQYDTKKAEYSKDEDLYKQQLDGRYDDDKNFWDQQLTNFKRANEDIYNVRKAELDRQEDEYKQSLADELAAFKQAKSDEYDALKDALTAQYNQEKSMRAEAREQLKQQLSDEYDVLKDSLGDQYDLLKSNLDKQVEAQERANQKAYDSRKRQLDDEYDELKRSLDKEVSAYQAATDARIREIDREYTEKYKLIDEEKYKALKEIDNQIAALDKQTENETRASREREYNEKLSKLNLKKINADSHEERAQAEQDYNDTLADLQAYRHRNEVADQKDALRQEREDKLKYYDDMKSDLQEQQKEEKDAYKTQRAADLVELKEHNADILKEKKRANDDALTQLKQDQKDQITAMKEAEAQILGAEKDKNDAILKAKKQANTDAVNQQKRDDEEFLRQMQSDNAAQLKEVQRANAEAASEMERSNKEKLSALQTANKNELTQLQRDLADQYTEYENSVKKKLREIKRGYDDELNLMKEEHKKQLAELKEQNRRVAEAETQKTKQAKKAVTGDEWKKDANLTPNTADYDKSMEQIRRLASMISDADAVTDKGMQRMKLSILGGLYGRYATFDELNMEYKNKGGVQEMIEEAYAATRDDMKLREDVFGSTADPFEGLEISADNAAAYLQALTWAFKNNNYTGKAAEESANTLSGAWRRLTADGENMQMMLAMSDEEAKDLGVDLDTLLENSVTDLGTFLFGNGDDFGGLTDRVTNVLNTIKDLIEKDKDNPNGIPKRLAELFGLASEVIGEALAPLIESIVTYLTQEGPKVAAAFYSAFKDNLPDESPLKGILDSIEGISTAITTLAPLVAGVFIFAEAAQGVAALASVEGGVTAISTAFTTVVTPISTALGEIGAAIALAFESVTTSEGITTGVGLIGETIAEVFGIDGAAVGAVAGFAGPAALGLLIAANEDVQRIVGEVFGGLAGVIGGAIDACSPIIDTFKVAFEAVEGIISTIARTLENIFRPAIEQIMKYVEPVATKLKDDFKGMLEKLNETIGKVVESLGSFFGPMLEGIGTILGTLAEPLGMFVGFIVNLAAVTFDALIVGLTEIMDFIGFLADAAKPGLEALGNIGTSLGEIAKSISKVMGEQLGGIVDWFLKLPERVMDGIREGKTQFEQIGKDIVDGFMVGAKNYWDGVKKWWDELPDKIMTAIKDAFGIHSPSTEMADIGGNVMTGFLNGITEGWKPIAEFFGGILDKVKGFFTDPVGTLVDTGKDIIGGLKNGVDSAWDGVKKFFGGVEGEVQGNFKDSDKWIDKNGELTMDGYKAGIDKSYAVVSKFFGDIDGNLGKILANSDKYLTDEGKQVIAGLKQGIDNEYTNVDSFFTDMPNKVKGKFDGSDKWLESGGGNTIGGYKSGMTNKWNDVDSYLGGRADAVARKFNNSGTLLNNAGYNVITGFYNGLVDAWNNGGITDFVLDIADWIVQNKGPESKDKALLEPAGGWIIGGLYNSMEETFTGDVMPFVTSMAEQMKAGFDNALTMVKQFSKELEEEMSRIVVRMSESFTRLRYEGSDILSSAGHDIIRGFVNGMRDEWERGRELIYSITDWIKDNKGPKEKDLKLLTPAGRWIMGSLRDGLDEAFRRDVMPLVSSMADEMERGFGTPMLVANAEMLTAGANVASSGMFGASAPQIVIQHMEVRNERDIHRVSRELNELWQMEVSGSLI